MKTPLSAAILFPILFLVFGLISRIENSLSSRNSCLSRPYLKATLVGPYDCDTIIEFKIDRIDKCFESTDDGIHQFHQR